LPVIVSVPPHCDVVPLATDRPAGNVSVNPTPVSPTVAFGFVTVKVSEVVPLSGIFAAPNALLIVGGARTVIVAVLLPVPVPPLDDVTAPLVLFLTPAVVPTTLTATVQVPLAAIVPPLNESVVSPGFGANVPPQDVDAPGVLATANPAGRLSVNATPVNAVVVFGLVIVNVRVVVPFSGIVAAPKALEIVGGPTTVMVAVLLVAPAPLSFELTAPVVLLSTPAAVPVTVTLIEQFPAAAIVPPVTVRV